MREERGVVVYQRRVSGEEKQQRCLGGIDGGGKEECICWREVFGEREGLEVQHWIRGGMYDSV